MTESASPPAPASTARPLDGVRILDFTRVLAGPLSTALLADLGVTPRADLSDDVSVTRHQGQPTLRAKTKLDWLGRLFFGLVFLVGYLALTLKILSIK